MFIVSYYLGRPAHVWSAAMSRRNSARQAREGGGLAHSDISGQAAAGLASAPAERVTPGRYMERGMIGAGSCP
jgi:hypothetical protein